MIATITDPSTDPTAFRERKKLASMRHIQSAALDLFEARGFDAVTVEEIAAAAGVSAPTVYRQFGSKEQLVLWDEYDPLLYAAIRQRFEDELPLAAIRHGLIAVLDRIYGEDQQRILRRSRLMANANIRAASAAGAARMRQELAHTLTESPFIGGAFGAEILAGAVVATLHATAEEWLRTEGRFSLRAIFDEAFERLTELTAIG